MKCGRNKATALLIDIAGDAQKELAERMKTGPFSISTDGSNDSSSKQYPLVVRMINDSGLVHSELLSIPVCSEASTGENIFQLMDSELKSKFIPWDNCISFGCDNANVMTGQKKGVFSFVKNKQSTIFLSGCPLHLVHIGAKKAAQALPGIEEVLIDIFYYFNKSEERKAEFSGTRLIYDVEQKKMLKHVPTRWLSIGHCLERLIQNWDPLKVYFKSQFEDVEKRRQKQNSRISTTSALKAVDRENKKVMSKQQEKNKQSTSVRKQAVASQDMPTSKKDEHAIKKTEPAESSYAEKKVEGIYSFIRSPTNRLYVLFLNFTIHVYGVLLNLQCEEPKVHVLRRSLLTLLCNLMIRFVKPSAMGGKPVFEVEYSVKKNQKEDSELMIGEACQKFIENRKENHLRDSRLQEFHESVRAYFTKACDYLLKKLPLHDPLLAHAEVADVFRQHESRWSDLSFFLDKYPILIPEGSSKDSLMIQFAAYQTADVQPCMRDRMDATWVAIGNLKDEEGRFFLRDLSKTMCGILRIQHSSAHCERVFSVRENRTDQRASLGDKTLESLLVLKSRPGTTLDSNRRHKPEKLDYLKGSYYRHLKKD